MKSFVIIILFALWIVSTVILAALFLVPLWIAADQDWFEIPGALVKKL